MISILSAVDEGDGFSVTVTTAAEIVATAPQYVLRAWKVIGAFGGVSMSNYGPFPLSTAPNAQTIALGKGYWYVFAQGYNPPLIGLTGDISNPVYAQASLDADAEASQCRDALAERITMLALEGIGENVYIQLQPTQVNTKFPCVIITPWGLTQDNPQNLSGLDDWGNPNWVWICDRKPPTLHRELKRIEKWRQAIMRACHNQQWPVPRSMVRGVVEPDAVIDPRLPTYQFIVSQMVVRAYTREARGLGA